jgi:hypothetical protein
LAAVTTILSSANQPRVLLCVPKPLMSTGGWRKSFARAALVTQIETEGHCTCVGAVGSTALFFKPASDPSKSSLPAA